MGQATRTTKLFLDLGKREEGGANTDKRAALDATLQVLNQARAFYIDFFLAHAQKLAERISYYSQKHLEMRERAISANELLTWAEACTIETPDHPQPWEGWNFSERFPGMPFIYRRSVIKDAHWQGEIVSVESLALAQERQEEGPARIAWSRQPSNAL